MFHRSLSASALLAGVSAIALTVAGAASQAIAQVAQDVELDPITVVATKPVQRARVTPTRVSTVRPPPPRTPTTQTPPPADVPVRAAPINDPMPATETLAGVSTVRQDQINQLMPTKPADLIYGMPGVYVQQRPDDPGTAINIRGLQDFGRVNVVVDGARQNFQRSGHNANGIFYLEPELISSVDIIRGPVANVFGSGAIGGVASSAPRTWRMCSKSANAGACWPIRWAARPRVASARHLPPRASLRKRNCSRAAPTVRNRVTRMATAASFRIPTIKSTRAS